MNARWTGLAVTAIFAFAAAAEPLRFADPFVLVDGGRYYAYGTSEAQEGIRVAVSDDLVHWRLGEGRAKDGSAMHISTARAPSPFWAPEVYRRPDGKYVMHVSCGLRIRAALADSPLGPFVSPTGRPVIEFPKPDEPTAGQGTIDSSLFVDDDGRAYLFFVRWNPDEQIWRVELEKDWMTAKPETAKFVFGTRADSWETVGGWLNEGPFCVKENGLYYLTYSAGDFKSPDYAVGAAVARSVDGPWKKPDTPFMRRSFGEEGTGHHSFFRDRNGRWKIVFHAHERPGTVGTRKTLIADAAFAGGDRPAVTLGETAVPCEVVAANGGEGSIPLPEHPRPDWERAEWINLNGRWDFASEADGRTNLFPLAITVPFGWAAPLSGVAGTAKDWNVAWYRREIVVPESWKGKRVFLVVGACDREAEFFLDDLPMGRHVGGYTPIEVDLTPFVKFGTKQSVRLRVDDSPNDRALTGKQGYGNVRGIWQTVYLEARGEDWFDYVHFTPSIAGKSVRAEISLGLPSKAAQVARVTVDGRTTDVPFAIGESEKSVDIPVEAPHLWTPDDPYLYDVRLELGSDRVSTYFGFREIGVGFSPLGDPYVTLNGRPHYLRLTLDQSYHPEGFYTFPTDEFMRNEILLTKRLGLDGNRVHIKVEVPRKLYWADRLGVLIQADVPNAWGHAAPEMFDAHRFCLEGMIRRDYNHPSIYQWTLFNESWGIFTPAGKDHRRRLPDTYRRISQAYRLAKRLDPSRLVEDESACCFDHIETDVNSIHGYHTAGGWEKRLPDDLGRMKGEGSRWNYADGCRQRAMTPYLNSECGNAWGYKGSAGDSDWSWDYHGMMNTFRKHPKCAGWLYTEHHDVINEWNGYVRADRTPRDPGYGALCPGMTFRDLHGDAVLSLGAVPGAKYACGGTMKVPLDISLVSDAFTDKDFEVTASLRYLDRDGRLVERPLPDRIRFRATRWQHGRIGEVSIVLPDAPAAGTVNFALACDGRVLMRNFQAFACGTGMLPLLKPSSAKWSQKAFEVLDGQKQCGCGRGYFEYAVESATDGRRFRAEISPRPLMGRDVGGLEGPKSDLDMFRMGGWNNGGNYPNSYPMTCSVRHPTTLRVLVDGKLAKTVRLENDPADSQGILSHLAQRNDGILREAGTYGELVEVPLGAAGRHTVRLETDDVGLAVYGPEMGRYPFGPEVR